MKRRKKPLSEKNKVLKRKVALTRLKARAETLGTVFTEKRFFLDLLVPSYVRDGLVFVMSASLPFVCWCRGCLSAAKPQPLCVSHDLTVGALIDTLASKFKLINRNNESVPDSQRLYLFTEHTDDPMEYSATLQALNDSGVLCSGDSCEIAYGKRHAP